MKKEDIVNEVLKDYFVYEKSHKDERLEDVEELILRVRENLGDSFDERQQRMFRDFDFYLAVRNACKTEKFVQFVVGWISKRKDIL